MINKEELSSEKKYLLGVQGVLEEQLRELNNNIYDREKILHEANEFMHDSYHDMDNEEEAVTKRMIEELQVDVENLIDNKIMKERQVQSPYFGRIDFMASDEKVVCPYYIGISHVVSPKFELPLVIDWRAPLASMYYDFELGNAFYKAPMGKINGKIFLKRQYKTEGKKLVYAFDSSLTINDEILRQTLGGFATAKMKNIVATIQTSQNKIIREDQSKNIFVQGVAGSGKTSIALHRVAYLLYKDKLSAKDILIISPSSLFSDYINNVLPELGEQNTPKITFDEIARSEFGNLVLFEPKSQMLEDIIKGNVKRAKEVEKKASFEFFEALKKFLQTEVTASFVAQDLKFGDIKISKAELEKLYNENYKSKNPSVRVEWLADFVVDKVGVAKSREQALFNRVKKVLFGMFQNTNIIEIYSKFLKKQKLTFQNVIVGKSTFVGYEEVPALLYIKDFLLGTEPQKRFKHIIVDEVQDYSPIAMDLINKIYPDTKTLLGDIHQTFEKTLDETYLRKIVRLVGNTKLLKLNTTYRSTMQIALHNQQIIKLEDVNNFNRDGKDVEYIKKNKVFLTKLADTMDKFAKKYQSVAVITPSVELAEEIYSLVGKKHKFVLIDESSGEAKDQNIILPVIYSKGLEFDAVIYVNNNFQTSETVIERTPLELAEKVLADKTVLAHLEKKFNKRKLSQKFLVRHIEKDAKLKAKLEKVFPQKTTNRTLGKLAKQIKYIACTRALHELVVIE